VTVASPANNTHETYAREEQIAGPSNRSFGFVFAGFLTLLTLLGWWRHHTDALSFKVSLGLAALFALLALIAPAVLAPLNRLWLRFGLLLHTITTPIILGLVFFLVVTPLGLLARLLGKDFLALRRDSRLATYWIERDERASTPESLNRQF
jgi:hypothetical protein